MTVVTNDFVFMTIHLPLVLWLWFSIADTKIAGLNHGNGSSIFDGGKEEASVLIFRCTISMKIETMVIKCVKKSKATILMT